MNVVNVGNSGTHEEGISFYWGNQEHKRGEEKRVETGVQGRHPMYRAKRE